MEQNHYYNHGIDTKIAFVFSVPGKLELYNNRPVVGETGVLLEDLMLLLKSKVFKDYDKSRRTNRYDYRITNAWDKPLYKVKDNKSEAADKEISSDDNLKRLHSELEDISDFIFVFGKKAEIAIKEIKDSLNAKIIFTRHLGLMSINQIKIGADKVHLKKGNKDNTHKRLEVVAEEILSQL